MSGRSATRSQPQQSPHTIFHQRQGIRADGSPAGDEPAPVHGAHRIAKDGGGTQQATRGGGTRERGGGGPRPGGDGKAPRQSGQAGIERIDRDNKDRSAARLLVAERRIEVSQPHLAAGGDRDAAHGVS